MAVSKKRLELNCIICSQPLTSMEKALSGDVLQMVPSQTISFKRNIHNNVDYNGQADMDPHQVIATKCGHMFHVGCLRHHVKAFVERSGIAPCPMCNKPVTLTRMWPVLIPPTPAQLVKMKKLNVMKKENTGIKVELADIRKRVKTYETELKAMEKETESCLADIQITQQQLDEMNGPTEAELDELRRIHKQRQSIVRVVTKHNADLLGVLMHETNVQVSETDFAISEQDLAEVNDNLEQQQRDIDRIYEGSSYHPTKRHNNNKNNNPPHPHIERDRDRRREKNKDNNRSRSRRREKFQHNSSKAPPDPDTNAHSDSDNDDSDYLPEQNHSSVSFSPNNGRALSPYIPHEQQKYNNRHNEPRSSWRTSSKEQFINPMILSNKDAARSYAISKTVKAVGMGLGPYSHKAVVFDRPRRRREHLERVGGGGDSSGLALKRKEGTRGLLAKAQAQNSDISSFVNWVGTRSNSNKNNNSNGNRSHNISSNKVKIRPLYRPKWAN